MQRNINALIWRFHVWLSTAFPSRTGITIATATVSFGIYTISLFICNNNAMRANEWLCMCRKIATFCNTQSVHISINLTLVQRQNLSERKTNETGRYIECTALHSVIVFLCVLQRLCKCVRVCICVWTPVHVNCVPLPYKWWSILNKRATTKIAKSFHSSSICFFGIFRSAGTKWRKNTE